MEVKIWPHRPGDGGILLMPMKKNIPDPRDKSWKLMTCPVCGGACWETSRHRTVLKKEPNMKTACTECGLRAAIQRGNGRG